jgi:hypothetical protein
MEKELSLPVPMVQKKNCSASHNNKKKNKQENNSKPKQTITFKKKKNKGGSFVCGSDEHWVSACLDHKFKQDKKSTNMVVSEAEGGTSGYGNSLPPFFQSVIRLSGG